MTTIEIPKFIEKYKAYEREGGVIDFRIFQLDTEQDDTPKMITMKTAILTSYYRHLLGKEIDFEGQISAHKKQLK